MSLGRSDFKGRSLQTLPLAPGTPGAAEGAQAVQAVSLVDPSGAPLVLAGSTVSLDPPGPYTKLVGDTGSVLYIGEAVPGTLPVSPAWRISRITITGEGVEKVWAQGTARFTHAWVDRFTLDYA